MRGIEEQPFRKSGKFYRGNLHTHCTNSDGRLPASEVIARYRRQGYDFLAMSDHFLDRYDFPVTDTREFRDDHFTTLISAELHQGQMLNDELWHVLAVGLPLDFSPPTDAEGIADIAGRAHAAGAFIGLVHPAWYGLQPEDAAVLPFAHAVEIYNHGAEVENQRGDGWGLCDMLLNTGQRIDGFATDDAHQLTHDVFGGWIHVKAAALDPDCLLQALKDGDYYSSQGPTIQDIRIEGEEIVIECSPAAAVVASGKGSRSVQQFGTGLTEARLPLRRFKDNYFRVTVVDAKGLKAWSNPIAMA